MSGKYILTGFTKTHSTVNNEEVLLHETVAVKSFTTVYGDDIVADVTMGPWIEHPHNLSQEGTSWGDSKTQIMGDSVVSERAVVKNTHIEGRVQVNGRAHVQDSLLTENSLVTDSVKVKHSDIRGKTALRGYTRVDESTLKDVMMQEFKDSQKWLDCSFNLVMIKYNDVPLRIEADCEWSKVQITGGTYTHKFTDESEMTEVWIEDAEDFHVMQPITLKNVHFYPNSNIVFRKEEGAESLVLGAEHEKYRHTIHIHGQYTFNNVKIEDNVTLKKGMWSISNSEIKNQVILNYNLYNDWCYIVNCKLFDYFSVENDIDLGQVHEQVVLKDEELGGDLVLTY